MADTTIANITANITGNVTGVPVGAFDPSSWIAGGLSWMWHAAWQTAGIVFNIVNASPIIGLIVVILIMGIIYWLLAGSQEAAARFMKAGVWIMMFVVLIFIIWFLQDQFHLNELFSGWIQGSLGINTTGGNGTVADNLTKVVEPGKTNFWK